MRLFIAIDLPDDVKENLAALQKEVDTKQAALKLARSFHLTIKFLGEVEKGSAQKVIDCLTPLKFGTFSLFADSIGVFPDYDHIRIIWTGFKESRELIELHGKVEDSLTGLGFGRDKDFKAHVTLARVAQVNDKKKFSENIRSLKALKRDFSVDRFTLYQSTLTREGPIYRPIKEFHFGRPNA